MRQQPGEEEESKSKGSVSMRKTSDDKRVMNFFHIVTSLISSFSKCFSDKKLYTLIVRYLENTERFRKENNVYSQSHHPKMSSDYTAVHFLSAVSLHICIFRMILH